MEITSDIYIYIWLWLYEFVLLPEKKTMYTADPMVWEASIFINIPLEPNPDLASEFNSFGQVFLYEIIIVFFF